jgi:hypothetical protein
MLRFLVADAPWRTCCFAPKICSSLPPAPSPHEIANGEIEADEHHERDEPLIALGGTVRDDKHAAVVDGRRASAQEGANVLDLLLRAKHLFGAA